MTEAPTWSGNYLTDSNLEARKQLWLHQEPPAEVRLLRPPVRSRVVITDAEVATRYVASVGDGFANQVAAPWSEVVAGFRRAVAAVIERDGAFVTAGDTGAFVCS